MAKSATVAANPLANHKYLMAAVGAVVIVAAAVVVARPDPVQPAPAAQSTAPAPRNSAPQATRALKANETSFDFGSVSMAAGKVTHRYWIRNVSGAPIVINQMYTSCMCTTAALVKAGRMFPPSGMLGHGALPTLDEPLQPNEAAMVEVVFDPAAHGPAGVGRIERVVTIRTDRERPLELAFVANVTP